MIRKNQKILLAIFLVIAISFSMFLPLVKATDTAVKASETSETAQTTATTTETEVKDENEIHNGDLYLLGTKVVMDKLVDGNVFIFGNEVEITGQVNGNLFVCANKITFNSCYIRYSVFACANSVYYNGACNDFYVIASDNLEMTYDSYVVRDVKANTSDMKFRAAVGRDADLIFNNIDLGEGENIPVVYGNLRYTAPSEVTIPEGVITETGTATYTNSQTQNTSNTSVIEILLNFLVCIITAIAIYALIKRFLPKFTEKLENENVSVIKILKAFGLGLATILITLIVFVLLLISQVGIKLGFILLLLFILLCLIAVPVFAIVITNILKPVLKLDKKSMFFLVLSLISIILYGLTIVPFAGGIFSLLITPISIGMLVNMFVPHKELTDEEKASIEEAKKLAKENKEKRKQEKAELKAAKKQEKEANKKENKE